MGKKKEKQIFFVKPTPERESKLAEECRKEYQKAKSKIKVVEKTRKSIKSKLVKSNPLKKIKCEKKMHYLQNGSGL